MKPKMQIETLIKKFYLGTLTQAEMSSLLNYLKDEEPGQEALNFFQNSWEGAEDYNNNIYSKRLYNQIVRKIRSLGYGLVPTIGSSKKIIYKRKVSSILRYAAVFILAIGLSWLVYSNFSNEIMPAHKTVDEQIQTVEVPYGSKSRIILPDGSVVTLNSGSSLKYSSFDFNSSIRTVFLTGEGFFSVTKDSLRPFYVNTPGIKLKALGTSFNVKAYPDENTEEAVLVSGKVEIYASSDYSEKGKAILLKPNQKAIFLRSENKFSVNDSRRVSHVISPVKLKKINLQNSSKTEQAISWKENMLVFDNEPFDSLVIRIERWYDVKIVMNYPELSSARFTGKFDKETLEQVLKALVAVMPFNYTIKQNQITISEK